MPLSPPEHCGKQKKGGLQIWITFASLSVSFSFCLCLCLCLMYIVYYYYYTHLYIVANKECIVHCWTTQNIRRVGLLFNLKKQVWSFFMVLFHSLLHFPKVRQYRDNIARKRCRHVFAISFPFAFLIFVL